MPAAASMEGKKLRAWWSLRQGLDGSLAGASPAAVLERAGWARSVAGISPYLTLHARAGLSREAVDAAVTRLEVHELPAARGCTYVLPAADYALGLLVGESFRAAEARTARQLGVTDREIDQLCAAVVRAVGTKPLLPDGIRDAVGGAARSLGEAGKKKGLTTTLPVALGRLQAEGEIRRVPDNGRLDQQRYGYVRWSPNPRAQSKLTAAEAFTELARRFFTWIGPARLADFQWFSGLGVKVSQAAVAPLGLTDLGDGWLLANADIDSWRSFRAPTRSAPKLVGSLDSTFLLRRDFGCLLDPADNATVAKFAGKGTGLSDLAYHSIVDNGRLVGFWEFDPDSRKIVWQTFVPVTPALRAAVTATQTYIDSELGDARSFSLDSPARRAPRLAVLRSKP